MKDRGHDEREIERGRDFFERIIHDAGEFGEENVDEIDAEWEAFEKVLRCVRVFGWSDKWSGNARVLRVTRWREWDWGEAEKWKRRCDTGKGRRISGSFSKESFLIESGKSSWKLGFSWKTSENSICLQN
jgi:hypothetical protein